MPIPGIMGFPRGSVQPAGPVVTISPESVVDNHYGPPAYAQRAFTLMSLIGTPSSYTWSIVAGSGSIQSGAGTEIATYRTSNTCVIRCAAVIDGITYTPEATLFYEPGQVSSGGDGNFGNPGGGSGGGELP